MARDPTTAESYLALRNALLDIVEDTSAVLSVLGALSDAGATWLATAYYDLRRALVQGRLRDAEVTGRLVGAVLAARDQGSSDELAEGRLHRESMQWLLDGIGAILAQDNDTGILQLERLTEAVFCNESLRWVAWFWMAKAAADKGDLPRAKRASEETLGISGKLDQMAQATTLCATAEIAYLGGEPEVALRQLGQATTTFDQMGDMRGKAMAALALGRLLVRMGRDEDAVRSGKQAAAADPEWEEPAVFLSERTLTKGQPREAERILRPFCNVEPRPPQVGRQLRLIESLRDNTVPLRILNEYLWYKDRPPGENDLRMLEGLSADWPDFHAVRELLAWNLLKLNKDEQATKHFEELAKQNLDPEVRNSVLLGLGCLANRRYGHRQSPARVHATAAATLRPQRTAESLADGEAEGLLNLETEMELEPDAEAPAVATVPPAAPAPGAALRPPAPPPAPASTGAPASVVAAAAAAPPIPPLPAHVPKPPTGSGHAAVAHTGPLKAVFTGQLQLLAVPDLLDFMKSSRRTGTLVITSEAGIGAVHLRQGMITGAASPKSKSMGDLLLASGTVSEDQLKAVAEEQRANSPERLLGSMLVEKGLVQLPLLQKTLAAQIKSAIFEMVSWNTGQFAFEPDKRGQVDDSEIMIELDTQEVLLDVLREFDEKKRDAEGG